MGQDKFRNKILPLADKMFRLALSITGNKQDAEDVVQDAMLKVWQKKSNWDIIDNLEGYCLRSVRNISLDKIALKDNQLEFIPEQFDVPEQSDEDNGNDEQIAIIHKLITQLPEKQRTVFQLRDVEGLSYKEIAEVMNITEDQVKVNLFRARQIVKDYFKSSK